MQIPHPPKPNNQNISSNQTFSQSFQVKHILIFIYSSFPFFQTTSLLQPKLFQSSALFL